MHYRSLRLAAAAGFLVVGTCASTANQAEAGPARPAPSLPAPNGPVLHVTTEPELQTAMQQLESNTTIVLAPGTYRLTRSLYVNGTDSHVGIRWKRAVRHLDGWQRAGHHHREPDDPRRLLFTPSSSTRAPNVRWSTTSVSWTPASSS